MKHWVFDLDGTLVDSHTVYFQTLDSLFTRFGLAPARIDREQARKLFGKDFLRLYFEEKHLEEAYEHLVDLNTERAHEVRVFDGILDLLEKINSQGARISVWTGRDGPSAKETLLRTGIQKHLSHFKSCTCVANNKPHPEGLLAIMQEAASHHDEVVMIGDTHFDIDGARSAQVKAVGVSWNDPATADHLKEIADHHFHSVADLSEWSKPLLGAIRK